jgi:hypothetical protein
MTFLAPVLFILAVVIPAKLANQGTSLRSLGLGIIGLALLGFGLFIIGLNSVPTEVSATGDPGGFGTLGIRLVISALFAGATLAILGIVRAMSRTSKG